MPGPAELYNIARMYTVTTGTGTILLDSAVDSFLSFVDAGVPDGINLNYAIEDGLEREVGEGVYDETGQTLTRSVHRSTGTGNTSPINLSGNAQVFITGLAASFSRPPMIQREIVNSGSTNTLGSLDKLVTIVVWNSASGAAKMQNIPAAEDYDRFEISIKDIYGDGFSNPITIVPAAGTIEGQSSITMKSNRGCIDLRANGDSNDWMIV